ncbi:uncharacterized protein [Penaeus vannamei]|uniref:uncharacterized protein n=1 Tax=Penaeus vannamei TaxID=6689 RepID=UPI00387F9EE6
MKFRGAISKLKSGKAAGICGIPAELLKAGGEPIARALHAVLAAIWRSGTIPPYLSRGVVIPLWKGKGDRWDCSNHPGITQHTCILALRDIVERRREFGCGLLTAYIDLKKAFNTVHQESLGNSETERNSNKEFGLIASLYTGTESAVKCGGACRASFLLVQE